MLMIFCFDSFTKMETSKRATCHKIITVVVVHFSYLHTFLVHFPRKLSVNKVVRSRH